MFGPVVYEAFRQVKRAFDPDNVLNPGKVVDAPAMTREPALRPPATRRPTRRRCSTTASRAGSSAAIELCNGAGVCRKTQGGAMCPSLPGDAGRAGHDRGPGPTPCGWPGAAQGGRSDAGLPRVGRAVGRRRAWTCACVQGVQGRVPEQRGRGEAEGRVPARLLRRAGRGRSAHRLVKNVHRLNRVGGRGRRLANWLGRRRLARVAAWRRLAGIDRRRSLPELHRDHFRRGSPARGRDRERPGDRAAAVILLDDCFTTFQEPQHRPGGGRACWSGPGSRSNWPAICCGRAMISKGFLTRRPRAGAGQARRAGRARRGRARRSSGWSRVAS